MDEEDITIFINGLNLRLNVYNFDYMAPVPMSFSDLGTVNRVSDRAFQSLNLPVGYTGKPLKDLLKQVQKNVGKRKLSASCSDVLAVKHLKADIQHTNITDTVDAYDELETVEHLPEEFEHLEEEQMLECENDSINFSDKKLKKALEYLNAFLDKTNLDRLKEVLEKSRDEVELRIGLGIHLISRLAGEAYTSRKTSIPVCPCGCQEKLPDHENMWIGSENTWYGELDVLAGNPASGGSVSVIVKNDEGSVYTEIHKDKIQKGETVGWEEEESEEVETTEEECESPGELKDEAVKYSRLCQGLNQVIAQAVVFSFIEYNRHRSKGNCIPSILIDKAGFQYVIYSPTDDILLVSNHMIYTGMDNFDAAAGYRPFVVLWIILNHRLFFKKCPNFRKRFVKSGFHEKISDLQQFQNLTEYSKSITVKKIKSFANDTPNTIDTAAMDWFLDKIR